MKNFIFPVLLLLAVNAHSQELINPVVPNFRLYPGNEVTQTEVFITRHPFNDDILFSSCNTLTFIPFFVSEGIFVSEDGGNNWFGSDSCTGNPVSFHGGDPGITIDKNGTFILTRLGRPPFSGLYSHYSEDNGRTWSAQLAISTDDLERASMASDADASSPYYGRSYAVWVKFASPFPLMFSFTSNGARSWSVPVPVNSPSNRSAGGDIAVGRNGRIYTCWAGVTESSPFREIYTGFATSSNGGDSWVLQENAFSMNGITGLLTGKNNIRVNGLPAIAVDTNGGPRDGWIYIVTGEKDLLPAGTDPDIILHRSADGGNTWSPAIRVNQDALSNGKSQYFPSIEIDHTGAVNIIFYDDRHTTNDSVGVVLARSTDGGDTWKEYLLSNHNFRPEPIGGLGQGYQGDNIDITATNERLWPVWMDNSTGLYQIWAAPVEIEALGIANKQYSFINSLENFPNPFSNSTSFRYEIDQKGTVILKILDLSGRVVSVLVNEVQTPGKYEIPFTSFDLPAGIYLYELDVEGERRTGKMVKL